MKQFNKFDRLVVAIIAGLILVNAGLLWGGRQIGIIPSASFPSDQGETGMLGPIWIEFPQEMQTASVEQAFTISPEVPGTFTWSDNQMAFTPDVPLEIGMRYTIQLQPGSTAADGRQVKEKLTWEFTVRQLYILFLSYTDPGGDLYRVAINGGETEMLTDTGGLILDFAPSPNGEQIAFSQSNDQEGIDIWLMDREGGSKSIFLNCGPNRCLTPAWSPDNSQIAYSRIEAGLSPGEGYGQARIWLADLETGQTARLFQNSQKIGYGPDWSPEGSRLVYFDGANRQITIIEMADGTEFTIPSQLGTIGTWSPDGMKMMYSDVLQVEEGFNQVIYIADLDTKDSVLLYGGESDTTQYSNPVWSPTGEWVTMTTWRAQQVTDRTLMNMSAGNAWGFSIDDESRYLYTNYSFDPSGRFIVYQRIPLETAFARPEILLYHIDTQEIVFLTDNASQPAWVP